MNILEGQAKKATEKIEQQKLNATAIALEAAERSVTCNDLATAQELVN